MYSVSEVSITYSAHHSSGRFVIDCFRAVLPLISCAQNALEPACAVVSNISYYENLWQDVEFACRKPLAFLNFLLPDGGGDGGDGEVVVVRWWW